jgi:hypothetical protein
MEYYKNSQLNHLFFLKLSVSHHDILCYVTLLCDFITYMESPTHWSHENAHINDIGTIPLLRDMAHWMLSSSVLPTALRLYK